jgi:MFS family permease
VNSFWLPLSLTLVVQILVSGASLSAAVLAPIAAPDLGVSAARVGYYVAVVYAVAAIAGVASGAFIQRLGAIGTMQVTLAFGGLGQALIAFGTPWSVALAAIACGISLGPTTPATSAILVGASQPANRNLIFSLKQTGVPGGFTLAALVFPVLALSFGWRGAAGVAAVVLMAMSALLIPFRAQFNAGRIAAPRFSARAQLLDPVRRVWTTPEMRRLALTSLTYSGLQGSLAGYLVVFLTHDTTLDLVAAAGILAAAQATGVVGRIVWGVVADRSGRPDRVLALLGLAMALFGGVVGLAAPYLSFPVLAVACVLFGGTAMAWNGVYLAEVARIAPPERVGEATGAVGMFTFGGVAIVPGLFATIVLFFDSYAVGYLLAAAFPAASGIALLRAARMKGISTP